MTEEETAPEPMSTSELARLFGWVVGYLRMSQNVTVVVSLVEALEKADEQFGLPPWLSDLRDLAADRVDVLEGRPF